MRKLNEVKHAKNLAKFTARTLSKCKLLLVFAKEFTEKKNLGKAYVSGLGRK